MSMPRENLRPTAKRPLRAIAIIFAIAALISPAARASWSVPEHACAQLWAKADANHDGVVMGAEATPYLAAARHDGRLVPDDGRIGRPTFMEQCRVGVFAHPPTRNGVPARPAEASRHDMKPAPRPWGLP
jgi:hypothetical protein